MKKIVLALATVASLASMPAQADGAGAFIGGLIIGNILTQPRTVYVQPAPVYVPPAVIYQPAPPVIVYRNYLPPLPPQGDPYALQRQCHVEPMYNAYGQYLGQQQFCN